MSPAYQDCPVVLMHNVRAATVNSSLRSAVPAQASSIVDAAGDLRTQCTIERLIYALFYELITKSKVVAVTTYSGNVHAPVQEFAPLEFVCSGSAALSMRLNVHATHCSCRSLCCSGCVMVPSYQMNQFGGLSLKQQPGSSCSLSWLRKQQRQHSMQLPAACMTS
jgi:hypothetical protein